MESRDDEPQGPTTGGRSRVVAEVEPLDVDGVRTVQVGIALWAVGFVAMLPFYGRLEDAGRAWMLWACAAGCGLGLLALEYCRRRKNARALAEEQASTSPVG